MKNYIYILSALILSVQLLYCPKVFSNDEVNTRTMAIPERVALVSPANNFIINADELSFFWSFSPNATHYKFELFSDTTNFTSALTIPFISDTTVMLPISNYKGKFSKLFWCVSAINDEGSSARSEIWSMEFNPSPVIEKISESICIWPIPLRNELKVRVDEPLGLQRLTIYDLSGLKIYSANIEGSDNISVDASGFPNGALIIRMDSKEKTYTGKIIK